MIVAERGKSEEIRELEQKMEDRKSVFEQIKHEEEDRAFERAEKAK